MRRFKRHFEGSGLRATFLRAAFGSAGLQVLGLGLSFLVGIQLSRGLGVSGYGTYAFALSVATIVGIPTEFGLSQVTVREASAAVATQDWARFRGIARFATGTVAISSIGVAIVAEVVLHTTSLGADPARRAAVEFGLLLIPVVAQTKLCGALLMGLGQIVRGQIANLVLRPGLFAALVALTVLLTPGGLHASSAMGLQVAGTSLALIISAILFFRASPRQAEGVQPQYYARAWLTAALPMAMTDGMRVLQGHMAVLLLGALSTPEQTGLYRVADSTALMVGFPASMFNIVAVSIFARLWATRDIAGLQRLSSAVTIGMVCGVFALALPLWLVGRQLLALVFGHAFADAYPILAIACCSSLTLAAFGPCGTLLNMTGGERTVARAMASSVFANVAVGLCTIGSLGGRGAALGSFIGVLVWNLMLWSQARKSPGIDTSIAAAGRVIRPLLYLHNQTAG